MTIPKPSEIIEQPIVYGDTVILTESEVLNDAPNI